MSLDPSTPGKRIDAAGISHSIRYRFPFLPRRIPVEYLLFAGEGHEVVKPENREEFVATAVRRLARHLGVDARVPATSLQGTG